MVSASLSKSNVDNKHPQSFKLSQVIKEYHKKYSMEYLEINKNAKFGLNIEQVISECKNMKKSNGTTSVVSVINPSLSSSKNISSFYSFSSPISNLSPKSKNHLKTLMRET